MSAVLYALAGLFTIGCVVGPLGCAVYVFRDGERMIAALIFFIVWPVACLLGALPWGLIADAKSPDLATLKKSDWICSASHPETTTTYVKSGNVLTPITSHRQVCDQYSRAAK